MGELLAAWDHMGWHGSVWACMGLHGALKEDQVECCGIVRSLCLLMTVR